MNAMTPSPLGSSRGYILIFTMIMMLSISAIGLAMLYDSRQHRAAASNHMHRIQSFYAADGMMALLGDEILNGRDTVYTRSVKKGTVGGTLWKTTGSYGVDKFRLLVKASALGPGLNILSSSLGSFFRDLGYNGDPAYKDDYGVYWRGFIYPPVTGPYTFFVKADDESEFYLGADDRPANLSPTPIAYNYNHMEESGWPAFGNHPTGSKFKTVSEPIHLKGGKRYYFEYYHKENGGGDFGQVGWSGPDWITEKPIPGYRLSPYDTSRMDLATDSTRIGGIAVRYSVEPIGQDVFSVFTEGVTAMHGSDTVFRAPLKQKISLKAANGVPIDTMWARVIFYDYHSDKTNPEFESPPWGIGGGSAHTGMVADDRLRRTGMNADYFRLDSIGKPIGTGDLSKIFYSCAVDRWFDPWKAGDPVNATIPRYNPGKPNDCDPVATPIDTLFKNVVIKDSLPFIRQSDLGTNTYRFQRTGGPDDSGFFWIDGKGFGKEGRPRNYSYCMEMHSKFMSIPGLIFEFRGDDDVWLFINDRLVMDLGGLHTSLSRTVYFDELGLGASQSHTFDLFYCERQTVNSHCLITTNVPVGDAKGKLSKNWKRDYGDLE